MEEEFDEHKAMEVYEKMQEEVALATDERALEMLRVACTASHDSTNAKVERWRTVRAVLEVHGAMEEERRLMEAMVDDRFCPSQVVHAMVVCLAACDGWLTSDSKANVQWMELVKQFYSVASQEDDRPVLLQALANGIKSKQQAKEVVRSGFLRRAVQTTLPTAASPAPTSSRSTLQHIVDVMSIVAEYTCYPSDTRNEPIRFTSDDHVSLLAPHSCSTTNMKTESALGAVCEKVVTFVLSSVSIVFQEGVRLLQMMTEIDSLHPSLVQVMDLRGALQKIFSLSNQSTSRDIMDEEVVALGQTLRLLLPKIDALEETVGSLTGLPVGFHSNVEPPRALKVADKSKLRGNWFFRRGNAPTAQSFYHFALTILDQVEAEQTGRASTTEVEELMKKCNVGSSVQVSTSSTEGSWRDAMVSDADDLASEGVVEVIYDDDGDEAIVSVKDIRLRMDTKLIESFVSLRVDCMMNLGKAAAQLYDHEDAVQWFTRVLQQRERYIPALYARGVAYMTLHYLKPAQEDLWTANDCCRRANKKERKLHPQIVAAYKRLQTMHARRKKLDKKVIKQMVKYLSTMPELTEGEGALLG